MPDPNVAPTKFGLLLVGHGTRDERGVREFLDTAASVARLMPDVAVEPGFLELAEPSIGDALQRLVASNACDLVVVPLLLFAAGHAKQDIPQEVARAAARFPHVRTRQAEPLGCHKNLLKISAERFHSVLPGERFDLPTEVAWMLVSRGSSDPSAIQEVRRFAGLRRAATPVAAASIGFMAVAEPGVAGELETLARSPYPCIVVQPHLLFHGKLTDDLHAMIERQQAKFPEKTWLATDHLGPCELVAEAAVDRYWEARELDARATSRLPPDS